MTAPNRLVKSEPPRGDVLRALVSWLVDQLAAALATRLRAADAEERDPDWGMVSQKTLPSWIHPDAYVEACRGGKIEGARVWRRSWLAPRAAVDAWWVAESRAPGPANDDGGSAAPEDDDSIEAILRLNGYNVTAPPARK